MNLTLKSYLILEAVMMSADDAPEESDIGDLLRDDALDALWWRLTSEERQMLNNRTQQEIEDFKKKVWEVL